jgi:hypothetical protein
MLQVRVEVHDLPLVFACKQDNWLMLVFIAIDFTENELIHLNCIRCNLQVVF